MVRVWWVPTAIFCAALASALTLPQAGALAEERLRLVPHFFQGETLRYHYDLRTETTSQSSGPIVNPESSHALKLTVNALVRLDVLRVEVESDAGAPRVRLRATYEKSVVDAQTDAFDPGQPDLQDQYRKLEGRSIEFTLQPGGSVSDIAGLEEILPNEAAANSVRGWLAGLTQGAELPRGGIAVGQKWSAERPVETAPLTGLVWKAESTYLRNEACHPGASSANPASAATSAVESCAIILTRFRIDARHVPRDPTPAEYRRNGLRTFGKWTGTGESLTAISLRTGFVLSVTQSGTEDMDVTIASATATARMRYAGKIKTQSQINLVPAAPATER
jgi:hypothetical protein